MAKEMHNLTMGMSAEPVAGMVLAPDYRGYANLGIGAYIINHSAEGEPAELVISVASDDEKNGRVIGDEVDNGPDPAPIPVETMAVRLRFENAAGLDALEIQLRHVRRVHFPNTAHPDPRIAQLERDLARVTADLERERMKLVACSVVALADTPDSAKTAREMHPEYRSASLLDVERRVDECIQLRAELSAAQAERNELRSCLSRAIEMSDEAWSDLTYRERAMLKPTIDQWRKAVRVK